MRWEHAHQQDEMKHHHVNLFHQGFRIICFISGCGLKVITETVMVLRRYKLIIHMSVTCLWGEKEREREAVSKTVLCGKRNGCFVSSQTPHFSSGFPPAYLAADTESRG